MRSDSQAMQALHDEHAGPLWSYVVSLTGDRTAAEDVVQETLLRAWRNRHLLEPSRGPVRGWLFTVAHRLVIDDWRSARSRLETLTDAVPDRVGRDEHDQVLQSWVVAEALRQLTKDHRDVLLLCYYRGYSVAEAAGALGIAEGTVKSRTHYALLRLRLALQEMGVQQ